jgi:hypothetical protein
MRGKESSLSVSNDAGQTASEEVVVNLVTNAVANPYVPGLVTGA